MVKRRDSLITSGKDERDECKRTVDEASKGLRWHQNQGFPRVLGEAWKGTYLLSMRWPVYRRRDSHSGFRMEVENLAGDAKGKGTRGSPTRPKVPKRRPGAHCFVVARKQRNSCGAKGAGHLGRDWVNG